MQATTAGAVPGGRTRSGEPPQPPSALPSLGAAAGSDTPEAPPEKGDRKGGPRLEATSPVLLRIATKDGSVYRRPLARGARDCALDVALEAGGAPVAVFRVQTDGDGIPVAERKAFDCDPAAIDVGPITFTWPNLRRYIAQVDKTLRFLGEVDDIDPDEIAALTELRDELLEVRRGALSRVFSDHPPAE